MAESGRLPNMKLPVSTPSTVKIYHLSGTSTYNNIQSIVKQGNSP